VRGQSTYDEAFYKTQYNNTSVGQFLKYARDLEQFVRKQGWNLDIKFNKHYCCFKAGFFNAFGIKWIGTKTFAFFFMIPEKETKAIDIPMTRYVSQWKEAVYFIDPGKTKISDFKPLLELAYKKLSGD
jgi:hypothetical protein